MGIDGRRGAVAPFADDRAAVVENAGLWLDKYLDVLDPTTDEEKNAIRDLIARAAGVSVPEGYQAACRRRETALRSHPGGFDGGVTVFGTARALGRLVVGLGAHSVRETSLSLLPAWGVPYLPGSALKGLAAATARSTGGESWRGGVGDVKAGDDYLATFGDTASSGVVQFHDAWWIPEGSTVPLDLDIMTVHHRDYYGGGREPPADWDEPNPVAFVTARGKYRVALSGPAGWVLAAFRILEHGLRETGLGAKTNAGYGRMELVGDPGAPAAATGAAARQSGAGDGLETLLPRAERVAPGTAASEVPALLAACPADRREAVARVLVRRLGRGWIKARTADWARDLLAAAGEGTG